MSRIREFIKKSLIYPSDWGESERSFTLDENGGLVVDFSSVVNSPKMRRQIQAASYMRERQLLSDVKDEHELLSSD